MNLECDCARMLTSQRLFHSCLMKCRHRVDKQRKETKHRANMFLNMVSFQYSSIFLQIRCKMLFMRLYIPILENICKWGWGTQKNYFNRYMGNFTEYTLFNSYFVGLNGEGAFLYNSRNSQFWEQHACWNEYCPINCSTKVPSTSSLPYC